MDFGAVMTATCLAAALGTLAHGAWRQLPDRDGAGDGRELLLPSRWRSRWGRAGASALGAVLLSGVAFFALTLLGVRERIIDALPASLRHAIAVGIGLFVRSSGSPRPASSSARRAPASCTSATSRARRRWSRASGCSRRWRSSRAAVPRRAPLGHRARDRGSRGVSGSCIGRVWSRRRRRSRRRSCNSTSPARSSRARLPAVLLFLFMAVFDAVGTLVAIGEQGGFFRDGRLPRARRALLADSAGDRRWRRASAPRPSPPTSRAPPASPRAPAPASPTSSPPRASSPRSSARRSCA